MTAIMLAPCCSQLTVVYNGKSELFDIFCVALTFAEAVSTRNVIRVPAVDQLLYRVACTRHFLAC